LARLPAPHRARDALWLAVVRSVSYARNWRYHKERRVWLTRDPSIDLIEKTDVYERGWYIVFDVSVWEKVRKDLTVRYDMLEEKKGVAAGAPALGNQ